MTTRTKIPLTAVSHEIGARSDVEAAIASEANRALVTGGRYAAALGFFGGTAVLLLMVTGLAHHIELPAAFSFVGGAYALVVALVARHGNVRGWRMHVALLPLLVWPTAFFVGTQYAMPAGAATYLNGPIALIYFVLIILTGFMFSFRLSSFAGLIAGAGYFACFLLARRALLALPIADPVLYQDLSATWIYAVKAVVLAFSGLLVGALSLIARRLILSVLAERDSKERIDQMFGQYVSPEVKEKILSQASNARGEKRQVAVLFCDLRGFSTFSEWAAPEQIVERLNEYFDEMVDCIRAHGGVVDKFIGDAVMAVFGGVLPLENPCDSALAAAEAMRARLATLNARWRERGVEPFDNGVGLHFGEVLQGAIGSRERKDFTVIGDAVNTASRVEGLTRQQPRPILLTSQFYEQLSPASKARCEPLGTVKVKGRQGEVAIFGAGADQAAKASA